MHRIFGYFIIISAQKYLRSNSLYMIQCPFIKEPRELGTRREEGEESGPQLETVEFQSLCGKLQKMNQLIQILGSSRVEISHFYLKKFDGKVQGQHVPLKMLFWLMLPYLRPRIL
mmetsp:Transcript_20154/g.28379  ORF Transcript_20154/g.28379 Transcript_20154/m.28379 type:complete len:115 (+) Transcript_20154:85-429(+)